MFCRRFGVSGAGCLCLVFLVVYLFRAPPAPKRQEHRTPAGSKHLKAQALRAKGIWAPPQFFLTLFPLASLVLCPSFPPFLSRLSPLASSLPSLVSRLSSFASSLSSPLSLVSHPPTLHSRLFSLPPLLFPSLSPLALRLFSLDSRRFSLAFFLLSLVSRLFSPLSLVSCLFSAISRLSSLVSRLFSLSRLLGLGLRRGGSRC